MQYKNIQKIEEAIKKNQGFDVIVIVASNGNSKYWEERLSITKNEILPRKTKIISIEESWSGGAGQLLGTLNAFETANKIINLKKLLKNGGSVAIYHTAGYGKRMAPLCGTEGNNKPAIKVPKPIKIDGKDALLTVLEAVIFSTQFFAGTREGRICVFWGDQVIIPSRTAKRETRLPVEIFGIKKRVSLSSREWRKNWQRYGILIPKKSKGILQREKLDWAKVKVLLQNGHLKLDSAGKVNVARSMGCFSIDFLLFSELLREFDKELKLKKRKLDTDEHLWMPLTSTKKEYVEEGGSIIYWQRIKKFKKRFQKKNDIKAIVGEKNLGKDTLWWDYGNLAVYYGNILKLLEDSDEGKVSRQFYNLEKFFIKNNKTKNLKVKNSILVNSEIKGEIKNSIVVNSVVGKAKINKAVIINSRVKGGRGENFLLYYLIAEGKRIKALPNEVMTDIVLTEGTKIRMRTSLLRDSKKDWKIRLPRNPFSYSEIEGCLARLANSSFKIKV